LAVDAKTNNSLELTCALEALHSTAGTCSYTAVAHATDELAEQGGRLTLANPDLGHVLH
jgi:ribonuclease HI